MWKDIFKAFHGLVIWKRIQRIHNINYDCVAVVCPEDDKQWNDCVMKYLPKFRDRKYATRMVVLTEKGNNISIPDGVERVNCTAKEMRLLMKVYCLNKRFFENIAFFYLDYPQDNKNGFAVRNGYASMDEVICLGIFHLREVPEYV